MVDPEPLEISLSNRRAAMDALVAERCRLDMSRLELTFRSGVSWDAIWRWRSGRREPTMGNLVAVAESLGFEIILRKKSLPL